MNDFPERVQALREHAATEAARFLRKVYEQLDPKLTVEFGILIVSNVDSQRSFCGSGLAEERFRLLIASFDEDVKLAEERYAREAASGRGSLIFPAKNHFVGVGVSERNEALNTTGDTVWITCGAANHSTLTLVPMIGVTRDALQACPHVALNGERPISLLWSLTFVVLRRLERELTSNDALSPNFRIAESADQILREAGQGLLFRALSTFQTNALFLLRGNVFEDITHLGTQKYESAQGFGALVFASADDNSLQPVTCFTDTVPLSNPTWARKALELCTRSISIVCNEREMFGLVREVTYGARFRVSFLGSEIWSLAFMGDPVTNLMEVVRGVPRLPRQSLSRAQFDAAVLRVFATKTTETSVLWSLVEAAREQRHGTMLVVSYDASSEASRLSSQALHITPKNLDSELMKSATRIDGAVLVDLEGVCHAFGVILDGDASPRGNPPRGARYNSALRYTTSKDRPRSLAVVVSEDGHVDLLPRLRPQITRLDLDALICTVPKAPMGDETSGVVDNCQRLVRFYSDQLDDETFQRAQRVVIFDRMFSHERAIPETFDADDSDIID